ncbi:hypothetical protein CHGG_03885 [Chaetomium globosum CBS 148.51]|uniref:Tyrosyl-DNA phosphodiesterase n=1 Tax=Chaetomium globosum (strain ATCC 6205 / CBS 148.51 / DSM 1962 / NBRC 6347 / NRRL 1970) TaxID=306901 RepID=Q2H2W1_CHAGB|nr:uncharacterized protein CHGG_03885 [Chaetomium globosum CBS 148.51]EAQ87266.1 hypothetical protein CHGG_03885 [Chaetomium globosum CBS 148.51]
MSQAVWLSPRLPRMKPLQQDASPEEAKIGSGAKFKIDFLNYLRAYDTRKTTCKPVIQQLSLYDFSEIRGSLIASVPGRHVFEEEDSITWWGSAAMSRALEAVPISSKKPEIAIQTSSIATLGGSDTWLKNILFRSLRGGRSTTPLAQRPSFKVVFPTPDEIRKSLDGYHSGSSIHTKTQSPQQASQLTYLRPMFHHWANDSDRGAPLSYGDIPKEAGRKRAAPHIKTYIRYSGYGPEPPTVDWALLTSANLSKQAWGDAPNTRNEVRVASYEIGVLVWPELYGEGATMVPTFMTDSLAEGEVPEGTATAVALRMPYNLPLQAYGEGEVPWVATEKHLEPDWMGRAWEPG